MSRRPKEDRPQSHGRQTWIGGTHSVEETLKARPRDVRQLWVLHETKNPAVSAMVRAAREAGARVLFVGRRELDRVVGHNHQGVAACVVGGPEEGDFSEEIAALSDAEKKGMVLVALDQIQDPHNLGAIARSAVNLGAAALILPERRTAPVSPAALQASAGALARIKIYRVVNLAQALERCRESGFWIYGADAEGKDAWTASLNTPLVLVIGAEGHGLRELVRKTCDEVVRVPQSAGGVESLNASCAASVLLYEIARQKKTDGMRTP